jgi:hypothetical protein
VGTNTYPEPDTSHNKFDRRWFIAAGAASLTALAASLLANKKDPIQLNTPSPSISDPTKGQENDSYQILEHDIPLYVAGKHSTEYSKDGQSLGETERFNGKPLDGIVKLSAISVGGLNALRLQVDIVKFAQAVSGIGVGNINMTLECTDDNNTPTPFYLKITPEDISRMLASNAASGNNYNYLAIDMFVLLNICPMTSETFNELAKAHETDLYYPIQKFNGFDKSGKYTLNGVQVENYDNYGPVDISAKIEYALSNPFKLDTTGLNNPPENIQNA